MPKELLAEFDGEQLHANSYRHVKVEGTAGGNIMISVTVLWGKNQDTTCVTITPEELAMCNGIVNDIDFQVPEHKPVNTKAMDELQRFIEQNK